MAKLSLAKAKIVICEVSPDEWKVLASRSGMASRRGYFAVDEAISHFIEDEEQDFFGMRKGPDRDLLDVTPAPAEFRRARVYEGSP